MKRFLLIATLPVFLGVTGCSENVSPNTYETHEAGVASKVLSGVVIGKRAVKVDTSTGVGGLAGAAAGAAGGSAIGGSTQGNVVGAIGGAVVGGLIGNAADKAMNKHQAYEYIIKMKNGNTISIAQVQELQFEVGQHVLVIYGKTTRIVPDNTIK